MSTRLYSSQFSQALSFAAEAHCGQTRKGTSIPYVSHLLAVCAIVLEQGGSETEAIAAVLHDTVEDAGGLSRLAEIREQFGEDVANIVEGCSDSTTEDPAAKLPWRIRKEHHLDTLKSASPSIALVSAADKLHNARSIATDLDMFGHNAWDKFKAGRNGTLWYYTAVAETLRGKVPSAMSTALDLALEKLARERVVP